MEEREFILRIFYQFDVIELAGSSEEGEKVFDQETIDFIVELNLKGVPIAKLNSETALHLMNLVCEIRPDKGILEKIKVTNVNPIFTMIYKGIKSRLPDRVKGIIEVESNSAFF